MRRLETSLPEVWIVEPQVFRDDRGFFLETYHSGKFAEIGIDRPFVQDNQSRSAPGILRGLHAQLRSPQGKLVRATRGEIFDVAVDIRPDSPTYRQWTGVRLSEDDFRMLWIPEGFAHGFCVLSDGADVQYKCTALYAPGDEITVRWDDPAIGIEWPLEQPRLSERDATAPLLAEHESALRAAATSSPARRA
ncbi:MAG: dTDP-4-dehydrorhamnose 3,5-epimerase [Acidobacteria bacterium]|nr:MAG: dTDP-4-dehydrorhamnose 3,5-epimerase [Acidobacteriota bacterium]REK11020.1 MAG: dTDP-4-dehydrorhamnose 3,5-epimerase [Acidobacteriota bacterium]